MIMLDPFIRHSNLRRTTKKKTNRLNSRTQDFVRGLGIRQTCDTNIGNQISRNFTTVQGVFTRYNQCSGGWFGFQSTGSYDGVVDATAFQVVLGNQFLVLVDKSMVPGDTGRTKYGSATLLVSFRQKM